jgi:hypothetical protein
MHGWVDVIVHVHGAFPALMSFVHIQGWVLNTQSYSVMSRLQNWSAVCSCLAVLPLLCQASPVLLLLQCVRLQFAESIRWSTPPIIHSVSALTQAHDQGDKAADMKMYSDVSDR